MNLLTKTTLLYLLLTLLVFGVGGIITYKIVQDRVKWETRRHLIEELAIIKASIERGADIPSLNNKKHSIQLIEGPGVEETRPKFTDTLVMHPYLKRIESNPKLTINKEIAGQMYRISLFDIIVEPSDIYKSVFRSLSRTFGLLVIVVTLFAFIFSKWMFQPFHETLAEIRSYRLKDARPLALSNSHTREFKQLNHFLSRMTKKVQQDYLSLKEFTENASHEIQTPLAIAKGKLELLMESQDLSPEQGKLVNSAYTSLTKLSKLNHSLALITKIENREFSNQQLVNFTELWEDKVYDFNELMELKGLELEEHIARDIYLYIDPMLADILISNLLQNAIKHNVEGGKISLFLGKGTCTIRNHGASLSTPPDQLFERFRKNNPSSNSLGLGLSIVKKICQTSKIDITYTYQEPWHQLTMEFPQASLNEKSFQATD